MKSWLILLSVLSLRLSAAEHPELRAYPESVDGLVRHVIVLPHRERGEEDAFKVELMAGKVLSTDGVNRLRMSGEITEKIVQGWGYPYYQVSEPGPVASTLMAPLEGVQPVNRFVAMPGKLIRYNSRLPVVVYAPEGVEVRYRIWSAPAEFDPADIQ